MFDPKEQVEEIIDATRQMEPELVSAIAQVVGLQFTVDDALAAVGSLDSAEHRALVKDMMTGLHAKLGAMLERMA